MDTNNMVFSNVSMEKTNNMVSSNVSMEKTNNMVFSNVNMEKTNHFNVITTNSIVITDSIITNRYAKSILLIKDYY